MKYVLVSGGVISGIGKGIIASSTGLLLKTIGLKVTSIKVDPYMNVDAGTMSPTEHGEVFVLNDGGEADLDLGNYERYLGITLTRENNITTGKIYQHVINRERVGDYLGKTVQVVPHVTDAIQDWIERVARIPVDDTGEEPDVCIIELGGTVGDIESAPFIEAMTQLRRRAGKDNFLHTHVSMVLVINGEQKTKPTQNSIKEVRSAGMFPDLIACRCPQPLERATTDKIARWCQVQPEQVIAVHDVSSTYHVPLLLENQGLVLRLQETLRLDQHPISRPMVEKGAHIWKSWKDLTCSQDQFYDTVTIALVGKYTNLHDSYLSVIRALEHSAMALHHKLDLKWVEASHLDRSTMHTSPADFHRAWSTICVSNGIIVPGGFGLRGTEGMITAANWARTNKMPYLGICFGMQVAVMEYARNVCGIANASSKEIEKDRLDKYDPEWTEDRWPEQVVVEMHDIDQTVLGGTMRLGLHATHFQPGSEWSQVRALYEMPSPSIAAPIHTTNGVVNGDAAPTHHHDRTETVILERHRHRFEVNPRYVDRLAAHGLHFVGKDAKGERMEIVELKDHPWFVGVQFHPEYLSRVLQPSKPYLGFVAASCGLPPEAARKAFLNPAGFRQEMTSNVQVQL